MIPANGLVGCAGSIQRSQRSLKEFGLVFSLAEDGDSQGGAEVYVGPSDREGGITQDGAQPPGDEGCPKTPYRALP